MAGKGHWWRNAVVYQIYLRSFQDSNGDGVGDLRGVVERLPYLQELGIDVIWLSPMFQSPMDDNGYDISDYYRVDPVFGQDEDMDRLIAEAKEYGIRIILDLVINHCSDEHEWFRRAVRDEGCEEAGFFYFKRTEDGKEPNNWRSNFGGSVWSQIPDGRWYYHTFSPKQPDLNWENPRLRREVYKMINWWLGKGIAGFRVDAITFIKKDLSFASVETSDGKRYPVENFENYPGIDAFLEELKRETFDKYDCFTVAEAPGVGNEDLKKYAGEDGFFSMIFDFSWESMEGEADKSSVHAVERLKKRILDNQQFMSRNGWCGIFLENHDQARCLNRYLEKADRSYHSASALATLYFFLHGTPYIYEGQEIGMVNAVWNSVDELADTRAKITWKERLEQGEDEKVLLEYFGHWGRDNARTPMQWNDGKNAGFTDGKPWLKVQDGYREVNVERQREDPGSLLSYYKKLIALRRDEALADIMGNGEFYPIPQAGQGIVAYRRVNEGKAISVIVNLLNRETAFNWESLTEGYPDGKTISEVIDGGILLNNYVGIEVNSMECVLRPYQALVIMDH